MRSANATGPYALRTPGRGEWNTSAAALAIQESTGTIEAGKKADLLVVSRNPLEDIKVLEDTSAIERVYVGVKLGAGGKGAEIGEARWS
ncbi:amidohydrolase family protein [Paenibacillus melissococcoides]|uniref:amidohydrolase family protein n=1 Tax=Paenibacillus TaxID=44249 RepID=UPI0020BD7326|nr:MULTISPECIES: amidohydrolase family protein [Paenibacillus]MEB9893343.1 amidohydrolase family protein [Bacillus cereus]CAH8703835.1 amidohydrolase family protein [Paenibacillus melissococcoides]CAH8706410.1 amidohydrolase family protein [Paenibacillus melissococcoides]